MTDKETNKKVILLLVIIAVVLSIILVISLIQQKIETSHISPSAPVYNTEIKLSDKLTNINIVPTMQDNILENTAWCGTFQLVWNDMQNNLVGADVEFNEPNDMVTNLNKQSFTESSIPEEYYYKKWGLMDLSLKSEIERGIRNKFNETSDILNLFDWPSADEEVKDKYFFYSILRRNFGFETEFSVLENSNFGNTENVEYFGIKEKTDEEIEQQIDEEVRTQVEVLYYTDENDFAVILHTKQSDQVMLIRNPEGDTFEEIYESVEKKNKKYKGSNSFEEKDTLSIPVLNIDILKEYTELENKTFKLKNEESASIGQAFQTIQMTLNNRGGSIKSEAGMSTTKGIKNKKAKPRNFNFNDKFAIFLISETNEPYFAATIENINLFR